jgi:hypothetical protein
LYAEGVVIIAQGRELVTPGSSPSLATLGFDNNAFGVKIEIAAMRNVLITTPSA